MPQRHPSRVLSSPAIVRGRALWLALGFKNARAFQRAKSAGHIDLPLYPMPGQARGWYARADELADYLAKRRSGGGVAVAPAGKHSGNDAPDNKAGGKGGSMT